MKVFLKTLYGKISAIFLILLLILGSVQIFVSVTSSVNYVCEASQKLHYSVAENLARKFQNVIHDSLEFSQLQEEFAELLMLNPRAEVYLLDHHGAVLKAFNDSHTLKRNQVNLTPVMRFLDEDSYKSFPIKGDDPISDSRKKVFSAAELILPNGMPGYIYVILPSARFELASDGILNSYILSTSAFALSVTLIFAIIIGLVLFFLLTKRLHAMTGAVKNFELGKYDMRIDIGSEDEVGELGRAFNNMADTIEQYVSALEKNDHLRRELIANVSHDLRSPLASIQGYLETILMKNEVLSSSERKNFLELSLKNVINLNKLVHELFELSKLDARQTEPEMEPFSIAELIQDVVLKFQPESERRKIHLITRLPVNLPFVRGDIGMIERVLSNLIENALHFTPKEGRITIGLERIDKNIRISVSDTGEGIPEEDLPHIFDRFYRVEKSRSRNSGGSGLGLAIACKMVRLHKSELQVSSRLRSGSTFSFSLPTHQMEMEYASQD